MHGLGYSYTFIEIFGNFDLLSIAYCVYNICIFPLILQAEFCQEKMEMRRK